MQAPRVRILLLFFSFNAAPLCGYGYSLELRAGNRQRRNMSLYLYLHQGLDAMTLPQSKPTAAFRKYVLTLLGENYGDKTLVLCPTAFVTLLDGDHKAAILLAQILYWADRTKDPDGWFYKSYADWQTETGLSEAQVRRIVNGDPRVQSAQVTLRTIGVETVIKKVKRTGAPTLHYRINQTQFLTALERLLGQGDSQHCEESIPVKAQDGPLAESGMNSAQSAASLINTKTTNPESLPRDHSHQNPSRHPDEDSDLEVFFSFEDRFGKFKDRFHEPCRAELIRLGMTKVKEVLDRCATRGRSWNYVHSALSNEQLALQPESVKSWSDYRSGGVDDEQIPFLSPQQAVSSIFINERVQTPWCGGYEPSSTVRDAWIASFHQLELQLDRASFETYLRGATLVDFDLGSNTFVIVVRTPYARDFLQSRLDRMVKRILSDVYGQPTATKFHTAEDWRLREGEEGKNIEVA
jgi:hypothetical protein